MVTNKPKKCKNSIGAMKMKYEAIKKGEGKTYQEGDEAYLAGVWGKISFMPLGAAYDKSFKFDGVEYRRPIPEPQTVVVCGKKLIVGNLYLVYFNDGNEEFAYCKENGFCYPMWGSPISDFKRATGVEPINGEVLEDAEPTDFERIAYLESKIKHLEQVMYNVAKAAFTEGANFDGGDCEKASIKFAKRLLTQDLGK